MAVLLRAFLMCSVAGRAKQLDGAYFLQVLERTPVSPERAWTAPFLSLEMTEGDAEITHTITIEVFSPEGSLRDVSGPHEIPVKSSIFLTFDLPVTFDLPGRWRFVALVDGLPISDGFVVGEVKAPLGGN